MKVKRIPNSIKFPEAWKVYIDCVRKWKEADKEIYPAGWKYGIPNPSNHSEYLYSHCPGELFIEFKNLYYSKDKMRKFVGFLSRLKLMEGKISKSMHDSNLKFLHQD